MTALASRLLGDPEIEALFAPQAEIAAILDFWRALAEAEAALGVIPAAPAARLAAALPALAFDEAEIAGPLADGALGSAVPIPALIALCRAKIADDEASALLHWGATSQDAMDTGLVLRLRRALGLFKARLGAVMDALAAMAEAHRDAPMLARTWGQAATPTRFGLVAARWLDPLTRLAARLIEGESRLYVVQLGGAAGTLGALAPHGPEVRRAVAAALDLADAPSWHAQRDRIGELGAWAASLAAALGKIGGDVVALTRSEIAEIVLVGAGGSSTMPQKRNPVAPSALVALARLAAEHDAALRHAALHGEERDGQAWLIEWAALPALMTAAGAGLLRARDLAASMTPDLERMRVAIEAAGGAPFAEAASFALAAHMPRPAAQALVKSAASQTDLRRALETEAPMVHWDAVFDIEANAGASNALIDDILSAAAAARAGLRMIEPENSSRRSGL